MAKTKQQVIDFLNSQVGQKVNEKAGAYNGQCVSLIKALLEFVGAPDPYKARGNAKDVGDTLLREGIASNGAGTLTVYVSRTMGVIGGVTYGHIWLGIGGDTYEQNGAKALTTTKNTRSAAQAQQVINLDKYVVNQKSVDEVAQEVIDGKWGNGADRKARLEAAGYNYSEVQNVVNAKLGANPGGKKSVGQVADEVIAGKWGNGQDRINRLKAAGYDPAAVQAEVNRKLK